MAKTLLHQRSIRIISALFIGLTLWLILSSYFEAVRWVPCTIVFNNAQDYDIQAPESVQLAIKGKRLALYTLVAKDMLVTINAQKLVLGTQTYKITEQDCALSPALKIIDQKPAVITITVNKLTRENQS